MADPALLALFEEIGLSDDDRGAVLGAWEAADGQRFLALLAGQSPATKLAAVRRKYLGQCVLAQLSGPARCAPARVSSCFARVMLRFLVRSAHVSVLLVFHARLGGAFCWYGACHNFSGVCLVSARLCLSYCRQLTRRVRAGVLGGRRGFLCSLYVLGESACVAALLRSHGTAAGCAGRWWRIARLRAPFTVGADLRARAP